MKYIIIDHSIKHFLNNQILDKTYNLKYPGASVFNYFIDIAQAQKWTVLTADIFLKEVKSFSKAVTLSNEFTSYLPLLIQKGVKPGLLISGESPNIARKFYLDLPQKSKFFTYAYLFEGSLTRLNPNCIGYPYLWPNPVEIGNNNPDFENRHLVSMVAAYKGNYLAGVRSLPFIYFKSLQFKFKQLAQKSLCFIDLYPTRLEWVKRFANRNEFKLSGYGWGYAYKNSKKFRNVSFANFPSTCDDKLHELSLGKFAIVFENCIYPGYVTEKIFDAFRSNTVPVYFGAPDISNFVKSNCYVDYRNFKTMNDLWSFLEAMPKEDWTNYRKNIIEFMNSLSYKKFVESNVANFWVKLIDSI